MSPELKSWYQQIGRKGGKQAAKAMTAEQKSDRARKGAAARWKKKRT